MTGEPSRSALPFWFLTASAFLIPVLPRMVSHGLFMDGLWYAVIARNLALGVGSFWRPMFTPAITPAYFADHPPLVFAIEALFYRVLGDHWWVAKVYSMAIALLTMGLIQLLWRDAERRAGAARAPGFAAGWLPLLFWVATPVVTWSFSNNMLENTMGAFILLASWAFLRAGDSRRWTAWSALAGAALFAGVLCKGVVALFPLAFPAILVLTLRKPSPWRALAQTLLALAVLAGLAGLVLASADARAYATRYFEGNFVPLVSGSRGGVANRLHIVGKLFLELLPSLVLAGLIWLGTRGRGSAREAGRVRAAAAFVGLGLAGSLPLVASPIQSGFYLLPSFAAFAVGFAIFLRPGAEAILARLADHDRWRAWTTAVTLALLVGTLAFSITRIGTIGRDEPMIADVRAIGTIVPRGATVAACPAMLRDWGLHGYLALYDHVTMDAGSTDHEFAVVREGACAPPPGSVRTGLPTTFIHLYRAGR